MYIVNSTSEALADGDAGEQLKGLKIFISDLHLRALTGSESVCPFLNILLDVLVILQLHGDPLLPDDLLLDRAIVIVALATEVVHMPRYMPESTLSRLNLFPTQTVIRYFVRPPIGWLKHKPASLPHCVLYATRTIIMERDGNFNDISAWQHTPPCAATWINPAAIHKHARSCR